MDKELRIRPGVEGRSIEGWYEAVMYPRHGLELGSKGWIWMPKTIDEITGWEMLALLRSKGQQRSDMLEQ